MMNATVVIVDDDPVTVMLHKIIVRKELGLDAIDFSNGSEILNFLRDRKDATPCLILLDIHMGGVSGWDVLDAIHNSAFHFTIQCFLVSSSVDASDRRRAMQYPEVIAYLEKPLNESSFHSISQIKVVGNSTNG